MPTLLNSQPMQPATSSEIARAVDTAIARIPPLWPLKHFVAVNPFVGFADQPFAATCELLQRVVGAAPVQSPTEYLRAFRSGTIQRSELDAVADEEWSSNRLISALETVDENVTRVAFNTVADLLDQANPQAHWSVFVVDEISKWCAVHFDQNQTTWNSPWKLLGLYAGWRQAALEDFNAEAFGLADFRTFVARLPADADACIAHCLRLIFPTHLPLDDFLHRQLTTISGWSGYLQYLVREDALRGRGNSAVRELLAIRLAYDAALFNAFSGNGDFLRRWKISHSPAPAPAILTALIRWQFAYERGYQCQLARTLAEQPSTRFEARPSIQAVFCIDVRSEIFRRHLEVAAPDAQTIGFAGFFGFPLSHRAVAEAPGARCPVLLVPPVETHESESAETVGAIQSRAIEAGVWKAFQNSATSCFTFVESAGLAFAGALGNSARARQPVCERASPDFSSASLETRVELSEGALRNMGLTRNFSRLVLFCGHGSESANNPYASSLDCGACGGHAGDVNARLAAQTLNDPSVRARLTTRGIDIPADTIFMAGLHHTGIDEVVLFDFDKIPKSHRDEVEALCSSLAIAGTKTRSERAAALGINARTDSHLESSLRHRVRDTSEIRPEWALANNAALVAAPRSRTKAVDLAGRVFLHDYDATADTGDAVLTLILCAPVVVASWINLQYYGSRVDPVRYGSGNKVLHNVVGGIGVLEGNGGDLRVGLPLQSIHDGNGFVHEPRRLSVYIDVARERIDAVLNAQPTVKQLFDNHWLHLFCFEGKKCYRYGVRGWREV